MSFPNEQIPVGSGYNQDEVTFLNKRFQTIEQVLEIDTRQAGLQLPGQIAAVANGTHALVANTETLAASGAISVSKLNTTLNNAAAALTMTLAAPSADGQYKTVQCTSAAHASTVSGTNVQGKAGTTAHFTAAGDTLIMYSLAGKWVAIGGSITWS